MMVFRPLLAATIETDADFARLTFPMIASPKVDGIRVLCHPEYGPCTRSLKPVPNHYIRGKLSNPAFYGLDGEVTVGDVARPNTFNQTTSGVMSQDGLPTFTYNVFDDFLFAAHYADRLAWVTRRVKEIAEPFIKLLPSVQVMNETDVLIAEQTWIEQGFEGIMLRAPLGPYKFGRSTFREQSLLKLKRFLDAEATIIGFEPLKRNTNEATTNALGLTERSSHIAGRIADSLLGALIVQSPQLGTFGIGSGYDTALREKIWANQEGYLGKTVVFKYQPHGMKEAPRFPIFKAFREAE